MEEGYEDNFEDATRLKVGPTKIRNSLFASIIES